MDDGAVLLDDFISAIRAYNKARVLELIRRGVNINAKKQNRVAHFHRLVNDNHIDLARSLIDGVIDASIIREDTPFHIVAYDNNMDFARVLIDAGAHINVKNRFGQTPLYIAVCKGHIEFARFLIDAGANISIADTRGDTPFHKVAGKNNIKLARILLDAGAYVNATNKNGETPLHLVARKKNVGFARLLVDAGADINAATKFANTPFLIAVKNNDMKLAQFLVDAGANINAADEFGDTPFHVAARYANIEIARLLVDAGADITATNHKGETAFDRVATKVTGLIEDPHEDNPFFFLGSSDDESSVFVRNELARSKFNNKLKSYDLYLKHIVKMKCLGLHVSEKNMSYLRGRFNEKLRTFEKQCEAEVESMKKQQIHEGYQFILCDVLTKGDKALRKLLQVEEVRLKLGEVVREMSYPVYGNLISKKFERIVKTVEYTVKARKIIGFIVNSVQNISDDCVHNIVSYFTDKDMRYLAYSFK